MFAKLKNTFYSKNTNYLLNYVTLSITDKEIENKVRIRRANQFKSIVWICTVLCIATFIYHCTCYFYLKNEPLVSLVMAALQLLN